MRLIKLRIKNIASLKEEHDINFEKIQDQSPLFAITGETGAGKSSILNAIGLVLYGKVYKSNVTQNDLVTLGEKEGQIELIFQSKGKNFLAYWRAKVRKQNGELYSTPQTPQRELYTLEGDDFSSPKTILNTKVEDLLNLDFDQFCKCIILNQGEFARFLSSSFTERKEILEKLYPGEMLESLSRELKRELDSLQKRKNDLDIELSTLNADGHQAEDLKSLKDSLEEEYQLHSAWLTSLEKIDFHFTTLSSYHVKYNENRFKIETIRAALSKDTTLFNEYLLLSQKAAEDLIRFQKDQERQLPRLQELLKSEEALRNALEKKEELSQAKIKQTAQLSTLNDKISILKDQLNNWGNTLNEVQSSFAFPLDQLKEHSASFEEIFELFSKNESSSEDLRNKHERLAQLEVQGKEEGRELKEIQDKKHSFDSEKENLRIWEKKKSELSFELENKQRAVIKTEELKKNVAEFLRQEELEKNKLSLLRIELEEHKQEYLPLENTLRLQTLFGAIETCLTHPSLDEQKTCPVCKTSLADEQISLLKENVKKTDFTKLKTREVELSRQIMKKESDIIQISASLEKSVNEVRHKQNEIQNLSADVNKVLPSLDEIEKNLREAQKTVWEAEKLLREEERLGQNLAKTREQYGAVKREISIKSEAKLNLEARLKQLVSPIPFIDELSEELITKLRPELKKIKDLQVLEAQGEKLLQENKFLQENLKNITETLEQTTQSLIDIENRSNALTNTLSTELGGKKASEIITALGLEVKEKADTLVAREGELKAQELRLKESQSRLNTLEEHVKEIDLLYTRELHSLRELGSIDVITSNNEELIKLTQSLGPLSLGLSDPYELFHPLKDLIDLLKALYKEKTSELQMSFASARARLEDWEKRQDKIGILVLRAKELDENLERRSRLYEVLGKDELRTFVLSLVEENLITQTNDELQKLCQGRYEIIHQSRRMKLTPEFYILDKFREGGLRKVSTLSGGETFMVSLAMALGLAEMTRGRAEIDTLFIDEGFGTLDQESLEDVLDMLKQIQNRGLMVGIISHVKALTNSLPVNLLVSKRTDGTSKVGMVFN